jgi:hypothetical protein
MQKLEREKKQQEETNKKHMEDLQSEEQRGSNEQHLRKKLEGALEVSFNPISMCKFRLERRKRA